MFFTHIYPSPLGEMLLASDGEALTGAWFAGQRYFARGLTPEAEPRELPVFSLADAWLDAYFAGENPPCDLPLRLCGTPFQRAVWERLLRIPYGTTVTYGAIAKEFILTRKIPCLSAQAVGGAVGHNPLSVIVPCHRVTGADGSLTGYAGGLEKKLYLLRLEGAIL